MKENPIVIVWTTATAGGYSPGAQAWGRTYQTPRSGVYHTPKPRIYQTPKPRMYQTPGPRKYHTPKSRKYHSSRWRAAHHTHRHQVSEQPASRPSGR